MGEAIKMSAGVQKVLETENYGEELDFKPSTFSQQVLNSVYNADPDPDELDAMMAGFKEEGTDRLVKDLILCATGWLPNTIAATAREDFEGDICNFLEGTIESDDDCPYQQTKICLARYNQERDGIERERDVANEVFDYMFGVTAEEMLKNVISTIAVELYAKQNNALTLH